MSLIKIEVFIIEKWKYISFNFQEILSFKK